MNSYIDNPMIREYRTCAESCCAPIFWRMPNGKMNNGTFTFLRTTAGVFGITNAHVADGLANSNGRGWQLGNAQFDPNRLIARDSTLDLATYELSDVFLSAAGKVAATVPSWPPKPPSMNEPITLGGYAAMYREANAGKVKFGFTWFAGKANVEGDATVGIVLNLDDSIATTPDRIPSHPNLGGCSGGPVFRIVDSNRIERLELAAIIDQCSQESEMVLARPLNTLAENGTFAS